MFGDFNFQQSRLISADETVYDCHFGLDLSKGLFLDFMLVFLWL